MREFIIQAIHSASALMVLEHEWRKLEHGMMQLPFVTFDWTVAWWTHLRSHRSVVRDELYVLTFRTDEGQLVGVAPMMRTCRPNAGLLNMRQLQFIGADTNITELRCVAAETHNMETVYAALVAYLKNTPRAYDWLKLTGIPKKTSLCAQIKAAFGNVGWSREVPNFYVDLKPTWAEFKSGLSRNMKESLRKCYNAPKRDGLTFEFNVISDMADFDAAISEFLLLHEQRSLLSEGVKHANVFLSESARQFLRDVCRRFAERGKLRVFQLKNAGAVIATNIGFVLGDTLYLYYSGYNPEFAKYSVMTTTTAEAIQYAISIGLRRVNLSTGRDLSKERWGPSEVVYSELEVASTASFGEFKYQVFKLASKIFKSKSVSGWVSKFIARNPA